MAPTPWPARPGWQCWTRCKSSATTPWPWQLARVHVSFPPLPAILAAAGATLEHTHSQLIALPVTPRLAALIRPDDAIVMASILTPDKGRGYQALMRNLRMAETLVTAPDRGLSSCH